MISIKLNIKTPLWTGDIDSQCNSLQCNGIMGSLRWWTEAILRGIGSYACDPTGDNRCPKENKNGNKKVTQYCPSCLIFGATGRRRMFRLVINDRTKVFNGDAINIKPNGRKHGWYLGSGLVGEIDLQIIPLDRNFDKNLILVPLAIAANWGGIGARTQHGYGVVNIQEKKELNFKNFQSALEKILKNDHLNKLTIEKSKMTNNSLPDIKKMFFAKVQFEAKDDDVKKLCETKNKDKKKNRRIKNWLFGTIRNKKWASKINVSCAYPLNNNLWEFRIWGWIPEEGIHNGFNRNAFLKNLKSSLNESGSSLWKTLLGNNTQNHKLIDWREFNSKRDNIKNYLQSLLNVNE